MRRSIWEKIREILKKHVLHGKWVRSVIALACIVTFITTYLLIMPAVTLSRAADCGQEEHTHTEVWASCSLPSRERDWYCAREGEKRRKALSIYRM